MKLFVVVVGWFTEHRKAPGFDTIGEAQAHVDGWCADNDYSDAFVAPNPGGNHDFWVVNVVGKTVIHDAVAEDAAITAKAWVHIRAKRDQLLDGHDKRVSQHERHGRSGRPNPRTIAELDAYANALADIITDFAHPDDVVWPNPPE